MLSLLGDTINVASRMESTGEGEISREELFNIFF